MSEQRAQHLQACYDKTANSEDTGFKVTVVGNRGLEFEVLVSRRAIGQMLHTEIEFTK